jgi:hypothetical protein
MNDNYDDWYAEAIVQNKLSLTCLGAVTVFFTFCVLVSIGFYVYSIL